MASNRYIIHLPERVQTVVEIEAHEQKVYMCPVPSCFFALSTLFPNGSYSQPAQCAFQWNQPDTTSQLLCGYVQLMGSLPLYNILPVDIDCNRVLVAALAFITYDVGIIFSEEVSYAVLLSESLIDMYR